MLTVRIVIFVIFVIHEKTHRNGKFSDRSYRISPIKPPSFVSIFISHNNISDIVSVTDEEILETMKICHEKLGLTTEPLGVAALAGAIFGKVPNLDGKNVLVIISGANLSVEEFRSIISTID